MVVIIVIKLLLFIIIILLLYHSYIFVYTIPLLTDSTTARQNVTLNSTLTGAHTALPEQEVVFTCITRHSDVLQWSSNEYISSEGRSIQIYHNSTLWKGVSGGNACAMLVSTTIENGVIVMVSELRITVSTQYPTATVQCDDNDHRSKQNITFGMFH